MRRSPLEEQKKSYFKWLRIKKIKPLFFFYRCDKCGDEFRREIMFECEEPSIVGLSWNYYKRGCRHCFGNETEFRNWLEETGKILKESDFRPEVDIRKRLF